MKADRIETLDVLRGVAVMGILVANLPAFGLPLAAYFSPLAAGGTGPADVAAWYVNYLFVEGRMRGLFSFLFGASMLLIVERAETAGDSAARVHLARMAALFAIGCAHLWLVWHGDILSHYALVGAIAFLFRRLSVGWLIAVGAMLVALQTIGFAMGWLALAASAARDTPSAVATWNGFAATFGVPPADVLSREVVAMRGSFADGVAWRWTHASPPLVTLLTLGLETLSAMLFGMAAWRSGFLAGGWDRARLRRWAVVCLGLTLPLYAALGLAVIAHGFDMRWVYLASIVAIQPLRPIAVAGYAALFLLLVRPGGGLTTRLAATGRAAFTNYLGTSIVIVTIMSGWGFGAFDRLSRAELCLLAPPVWIAMLVWSHWWLARFRYGPLEWCWRAVARLDAPPMRRMVPNDPH